MEKRTLIALGLSFLILSSYPMLMRKMYPDYYKKLDAAQSVKKSAANSPEPTASKTPAVDGPRVTATLKAGSLLPEDDFSFKNSGVDLVFNKKDGAIRQVGFVRYPDAESKTPTKLLSLRDSGATLTSLGIIEGGNLSMILDHESSVSGNDVRFTSKSQGLKIQKSYAFKEPYGADLSGTFENTSGETRSVAYELIVGSGIHPRNSIDSQYIEANFFSELGDKKTLRHIKENRLGKQVPSQGFVKWVSVKDRHFSVIVMPKTAQNFTGLVRGLGHNDLSASLIASPVSIPPGSSVTHDFTLYIGPNELEYLMPLGLEELVNFGKFDGIARFFVGALELLYKIFKNYGIGIIVLTILINIFLFPFTRVSYMSMKRMQLVQPQMNKLREQHKNKPQRLNKETMELYKKHKVNPFGGCLPMIIQIPIFVALYVALSKFVPLVNAKLLWIKDLSAPDRVYLPFTLPFVGNYFHLLPLLMCAGMFFQQKMTGMTQSNDPQMEAQQKMMGIMMPIVFGFIFYQMPSGLVLYWLTNTVLMTAYQLKLKGMKLAE